MMVDWLAGLMQHHPGSVNVPLIVVLLLFCLVLIFGLWRVPSFWSGRLGTVLTACDKTGLGLIMLFCLLGCVHFGMQGSLARHVTSLPPAVSGVLVMSCLLVVVPCLFRDENKQREKRRAGTKPAQLS